MFILGIKNNKEDEENNAKKIETILEKKFLEEINESVEEVGCMTKKQTEKVEKVLKKYLMK